MNILILSGIKRIKIEIKMLFIDAAVDVRISFVFFCAKWLKNEYGKVLARLDEDSPIAGRLKVGKYSVFYCWKI